MLFLDRPELNKNQYNRISNIFDGTGIVTFGITVLGPIIAGFDKVNVIVVLLSLLLTVSLWLISIWFSKKG